MLNEVMAVVGSQGWFDTTKPYEKTVYLSQGASLWMVLSRQGRPDTFVKFSGLVSLQAEAARLATASERYPHHAPRFVGHARCPPLEVLATQAVEFRALTARMTRAPTDAEAVRAGLDAFFQRMRSNGPASDADAPRRGWLEDMARYFARHRLGAAAAKGLKQLFDAVPCLPALPQHGDLVMNNLALDRRRRLIVFDWEDYGAVELPGLDLFTLEYSLTRESALRFPQESARGPVLALDVGACCAALGLDPAQYRELRLGYALAFRYLKRNYGPEIQANLDLLIERLAD